MATQPDQIQTQPLEREALLQQARERAGLADFGDEWFFEPMDHFVAFPVDGGQTAG